MLGMYQVAKIPPTALQDAHAAASRPHLGSSVEMGGQMLSTMRLPHMMEMKYVISSPEAAAAAAIAAAAASAQSLIF
jgi:hypothetical protein